MKREKMMTLLTKLLLDLIEFHPRAFVNFITPALQLSINYNFTADGRRLSYERFSVNTLNIMRSILRNEVYRPAATLEGNLTAKPHHNDIMCINLTST